MTSCWAEIILHLLCRIPSVSSLPTGASVRRLVTPLRKLSRCWSTELLQLSCHGARYHAVRILLHSNEITEHGRHRTSATPLRSRLMCNNFHLTGKRLLARQFLRFKRLNVWPHHTTRARCDLVRATVICSARDTQGGAETPSVLESREHRPRKQMKNRGSSFACHRKKNSRDQIAWITLYQSTDNWFGYNR